MIKALPFLFLLDYSGSMDQNVSNQQNQTKIQVLKNQMQGVLESARSESRAQMLILGSEPQKKCKDIYRFEANVSKMIPQVQKIKPGAYGRTPLSDGLVQLTDMAIQSQTKNIITITDGGDTCGKDPCKTLEAVNEKLKKKKQKIKLFMIGFDLKNEKEKLSCFKNLKLEFVEISLLEANDGNQLQSELKKAQAESLGMSADIENDQNNLAGQSSTAKAAKNKSQQKKDKTKASMKTLDGLSYIEVSGAPIEAQFEMTKADFNKKWRGDFLLEVDPGEYSIRFLDEQGITLKVLVAKGERKRIFWGDLMSNPKSNLKIEGSQLIVQFKPNDETKKIHSQLKEYFSMAVLEPNESTTMELPFGTYSLTVQGPEWLKDQLKEKSLTIVRGQTGIVQVNSLWIEELNWLDNSLSDRNVVLDLQSEKTTSRFLLPTGTKKVPILKKHKAQFLLQ